MDNAPGTKKLYKGLKHKKHLDDFVQVFFKLLVMR
jgi:hypothetical protein